MTEIHAFDPDGTPSPGAQAALDSAVEGLATEDFVLGAVDGIPDADVDQRGLMSATDKAHLDDTPTRGEVDESTAQKLVTTYSLADNFERIAPRYVTRLDVRGNTVMQAFARDSLGRYYLTQVADSGDGSMSVTRTDAGGRALDSAVLIGGGHGSPWGLEEQADGIYMWVWWNAEVAGRTNVLRRWKYTPGAEVAISDPSVEVMPDFVSNVEGFRQVDTSINQRLDLLSFTVRTTVDGVSHDTAQLRRLSDYKQGIDEIIAQSPPIPLTPNGALQGHVATMEHFYLHRGMSGAWPQSPHMDQYRWSDGERVGQIDLSHLSYGGADGGSDGSEKAEAEGLFPVWDQAGRMSLLFGIATGRNGANLHNIYSLAPTDFQADTGLGQSVQRLYAPLNWVDVPLLPGFAYRGAGYELQVARDSHGMVHLRGQMANTGLTELTGQIPFAKVPREYLPDKEVRWLAWATARADDIFGGWVSSATGEFVLQNRVGKTEGPQSHFAIIAQPWQGRA